MELSQITATRNAAGRIATMMKNEKKEVMRVYQNAYEGKGDVVRMRIFLISPAWYKGINRLYDKVVIPFRNK